MMTSLIWWAKCCHPYLWLQFPILISALNVWLSISIFKIKIDKLASQNQNSIFKIMLWVVNIKIQIQDSKVAYQDWYSTSTFASLLGNIQYQNQNRSRHQIQHQFQEYCQYQHQNQPISIILPTSDLCICNWRSLPYKMYRGEMLFFARLALSFVIMFCLLMIKHEQASNWRAKM